MAAVFDTSRVSPLDAVTTLRSLHRRFRQVLTVPAGGEDVVDPQDVDEILHRRPGAGLSPIEHAARVADALPKLGTALRHVLLGDTAPIDLPPVDVDPPVSGADAPAQEVEARLGNAAEALAQAMAEVHGSDWTRPGRTTTGEEVSALDIARLAVRIGIEHLRGAEQAMSTLIGGGA